MENNPNPSLVKHTDYPVSNVFSDFSSQPRMDASNTSKMQDSDHKTTTVNISGEEDNSLLSNPGAHQSGVRLTIHHSHESGSNSNIDQFAIEDHVKNTEKNPSKESTAIMPILVRKAKSYEVLPRPFRTTNQFICCSYISVIFCCCLGAVATKWAWKTKLQRNQGLYQVSKKSGRRAHKWMIAAFVTGCICLIINLALYFAGAFDSDIEEDQDQD